MGLAGSDNRNLQDTLGIWGKDPVHSLDSAYATIAEKVLEEVNMASVVNAHCPPCGQPSCSQGASHAYRAKRAGPKQHPLLQTELGNGHMKAAEAATGAVAAAAEEQSQKVMRQWHPPR